MIKLTIKALVFYLIVMITSFQVFGEAKCQQYGLWLKCGVVYTHIKTGDKYTGDFKYNRPWGKGEIKRGKEPFVGNPGDRYVGEFLEGRMHGKGKYYYANGDIYDGEWHVNLRIGKGIFSGKNGDVVQIYSSPGILDKPEVTHQKPVKKPLAPEKAEPQITPNLLSNVYKPLILVFFIACLLWFFFRKKEPRFEQHKQTKVNLLSDSKSFENALNEPNQNLQPVLMKSLYPDVSDPPNNDMELVIEGTSTGQIKGLKKSKPAKKKVAAEKKVAAKKKVAAEKKVSDKKKVPNADNKSVDATKDQSDDKAERLDGGDLLSSDLVKVILRVNQGIQGDNTRSVVANKSDRHAACGSFEIGDHLNYVQDQALSRGDIVLSYFHDGLDLIEVMIWLLFQGSDEITEENLNALVPLVVNQLPSFSNFARDDVYEKIRHVVHAQNLNLKKSLSKQEKKPQSIIEQSLKKERELRLKAQQENEDEKNKRIKAERDAADAKALAKLASAREQDVIAENHELKNELAEKDLLVAKIEANQAEHSGFQEIKSDSNEAQLKKVDLIGSTRAIKVRGHPKRTLALRLGIVMPDNARRLNMKIVRHMSKNIYEVDFVDFSKNGLVALGVDEKADAIYASTFYNKNENWFEISSAVLGFKEIEVKDRTDISLDKLAQYYTQISARLSS